MNWYSLSVEPGPTAGQTVGLVLGWRGFINEVIEGNQSCALESGGLDFAARASSGPGVQGVRVLPPRC